METSSNDITGSADIAVPRVCFVNAPNVKTLTARISSKMPSKRKSNYKTDDSVEDDDEDGSGTARPSKRGKTTGSDFQPSTKPRNDSEGNKYWEISKTRRITIQEFKGKSLVNIREYYQADGKWLPGKKGISMTVEQYSALISIMPQIEELLSEKGEKVPRPKFDGAALARDDDEEEENGEDEHKKANIEATSDEEE